MPKRRRPFQAGFRSPRSFQRLCYGTLLGAVGSSVLLFALRDTGLGARAWSLYYDAYIVAALAYTWFTFVLLFKADAAPPRYARYAGEKIAVVMPCYNEPVPMLRRALRSVLDAEGEKTVIVVDDGSRPGVRRMLARMGREHGIVLHFFDRNQGKRAALHYAVKHLVGDCRFVVTMDSDTIIERDALVRVVEPLKSPGIGASSGDVRLLNERENLLTRMIGGYYWSALHLHRTAESAAGMVSCCSGALSAYRSSLLKQVVNAFVLQEFFGKRCTHSEDRHLTNLIHRLDYKVVFVPAAVAHTLTPATLRGFLKQQQRWRRGFIQEALFTLTYAWRRRKAMLLQMLLWELLLPFLSVGIALSVALAAVSDPAFLVTRFLPSVVLVTAVRSFPVFFRAPDKILGLLLFALFSTFIGHFQSVAALVTVRDKRWVTR